MRGIALSYFTPSPPLPVFAPATQGQKSPWDCFLMGTLLRWSEAVDFQTEVAVLLNIVIYCGGYSGALSRAKRTQKSIQEILVLRKSSARTSNPLM